MQEKLENTLTWDHFEIFESALSLLKHPFRKSIHYTAKKFATFFRQKDK